MANWTKYQVAAPDIGGKVHDLLGTDDTLKIALTNTTPNAATHAVLADITEIAAGNGYTAGGQDTVNVGTSSSGVLNVAGSTVTWTGSGGTMATFQHLVLYNSTANRLLAFYSLPDPISLGNGVPFVVYLTGNLMTIS